MEAKLCGNSYLYNVKDQPFSETSGNKSIAKQALAVLVLHGVDDASRRSQHVSVWTT
jgi:hypothetical protein